MGYTSVYGFPCVTDPHDFDPDVESCSPEEIARHKLACETWGTPAYEANRGCTTERDESGQLVRHVLRTSWGIGVNSIRSCDDCQEPFFDSAPITCHDCGGHLEFCEACWPKHCTTCAVAAAKGR